jgi:hypothetical protein
MGLNYNPTIVPDGLVMYFDPANSRSSVGSGNTIYDLTGNSNTCTFSATPTYDVASKGNLLLAGYGTVAHTSTLWNGNQFTYSIWAKKIGTGEAGERGIMIAKETSYIDHGYNNLTLASFYATASYSPRQYLIYGNAQASRNEWRHYATTYDGTLACLYENGALTGTTYMSIALNNTTDPLYIGQWNGGGYTFNGKLGTMMTYNRALSAQEVKQNYDATKGRYITQPNIVTSGLILNYDMSDYRSAPFTGNYIYDLSGSGNTGELLNGPTFSSLTDGSLFFDGTNDYVNVTRSAALTSATSVTVQFWVYLSQGANTCVRNTDIAWLFEFGTNGNNSPAGTYPQFLVNTSSGQSYVYGNSAIGTSVWKNCTGTYSPGSAKIYIDGVLFSTTTSSTGTGNIIYSSGYLSLGFYSGEIFNGYLSQLLVYNRVLSAQEILQNYNATKSRFGL